MPATGQLFTLATWLVKETKEAEFIAAWTKFAEWTSQRDLGAGTGHLLQDRSNPRAFLSFGPWESLEAISRWREAPEFKAFFASANELCDDIQPRTFALTAIVPPNN